MISNLTYLYFVIGAGVLLLALAVWLSLRLNARIASFLTFVCAVGLIAFTVMLWTPLQSSEQFRAKLASAEKTIGEQTGHISEAERKLANEKQSRITAVQKVDKRDREISQLRTETAEARRQRDKEVRLREDLDRQMLSSNQRLQDVEAQFLRSERELRVTKAALEERERTTAKQLGELIRQARRTKPALGTLTRLQDIPSEYTDHANEQRFVVLGQEIDRLGREEEITTATIGVRDTDPVLADLRDRMSYGFSTDDYEVEVYPDRELISGQRGNYYTIDLKDAETGVKFGFDAGRYTLKRSDRKFRKALSAFMRDVVGKLDGNADYKLMVRGSADVVRYRGELEPGYEYSRVAYLKKIDNGRYVNEIETRSIRSRVKNDDLPFLRARFLKDLVTDVYPSKEPAILEGEVTRDVDKDDRNAELMLFVNW